MFTSFSNRDSRGPYDSRYFLCRCRRTERDPGRQTAGPRAVERHDSNPAA
ncbi:hypothetical protein PAMC26510_20830 [Caballeronia sordidicola]|uniref:Uncharacterized protein n=1 Tax=Caballeronia sordidicola TaxID=196367 RepID=A0A242MNA8_CABSO|nr:hypothetical protein PAMC26577_22450 [Caballeronia sordidicola]OTP72807.1 hypothetical protein PAMC26510_20830 [Caballeronia sordidicola]